MPFQVPHMPFMQHQKDLNCGYYCERALLDHWYRRLHGGNTFNHLHLVKTTIYGYNPGHDNDMPTVQADITTASIATIPLATLQDWEDLLTRCGPIIVSGNLGGADWGTWRLGRKWKAGVGHYILIVGTDVALGTMDYKDPLQGDGIRTGLYTHIAKRLDDEINYIGGQYAATRIFNNLQTDVAGVPGQFGRAINKIRAPFGH